MMNEQEHIQATQGAGQTAAAPAPAADAVSPPGVSSAGEAGQQAGTSTQTEAPAEAVVTDVSVQPSITGVNMVGAGQAGVAPPPYQPQAGGVPYTPPYNPAAVAHKPRQPFTATKVDGWLAIGCLVLGFLFVRWVSVWEGWGVFAFTVLYACAILGYAKAKGLHPKGAASWFWMAVMLLCGLCYALWPAGLLLPYQSLLLLGSGVYWAGCLFGVQLQGKTGNFLPLDAINLLFCIPFSNVDAVSKGLRSLRQKKQPGTRGFVVRRVLPVLLALILLAILLAVLLPMLFRADSAGFGRVVGNFFDDFAQAMRDFFADFSLWEVFVQLFFGVPIGFYLCGLLAGSAHKRYVDRIELGRVRRRMLAMRAVPDLTIWLVLGVVSLVYLLFIGFQVPYFFSAFGGVKPEQYEMYSQYAREGFFELCRIAAINLGLLALANSFGKTAARRAQAAGDKVTGGKNLPLMALNLVLCALTLLVIATAFSKMGLYISAHGFTPKRIMTCVFMLFLAGVCVAAMLLQFRRFSIMRVAAVYGAGLLCALCLCNLDGMVVHYNAARYLDGSLPTFDAQIVLRSGPSGVPAALEVYNQMDEEADYEARERLAFALVENGRAAVAPADTSPSKNSSTDCVMNAYVRGLDLPDDPEKEGTRRELFTKEYGQKARYRFAYEEE